MRVHLVTAHPVAESYNAVLRARIIASLHPRHSIDLLDLYAEDFNPVMSSAERLGYHDIPANRTPMAPYIARLLAADALILCFPAWSFAPPAILKGWHERVMVPGVGFNILPDGRVQGGLTHMHKVAGVVTYGQTRWKAALTGDYPRKLVPRILRRSIGLTKPAPFLAHYAMNVSTPQSRQAFLDRVGAEMARF